jgi:hypothetical protein
MQKADHKRASSENIHLHKQYQTIIRQDQGMATRRGSAKNVGKKPRTAVGLWVFNAGNRP